MTFIANQLFLLYFNSLVFLFSPSHVLQSIKVRPIAVFTKCHTDSKPSFSINNELRSIHLALQYESSLSPQIMGVTVSTQDQIYDKWRDFVSKCKLANADGNAVPKLYALSLDIKRCFDTLPQDRILQIIRDVLKEDSYVIKKFVKIKKIQERSTRNRFVSMASNGFDCTNFVAFIRKEMESGRIVGRNAVFVDKVFYRTESREQLLSMATKHIKHSIGYDGDRYLLQSTGMYMHMYVSCYLSHLYYIIILRSAKSLSITIWGSAYEEDLVLVLSHAISSVMMLTSLSKI